MTRVVPYGGWPSPVTPAALAQASLSLGHVALDGDVVWWAEGRPAEGGRVALVAWRSGDAAPHDVLPAPWSVRTRIHEYGGGAFAVARGVVCFSHDADQRVYRWDGAGTPRPLTPPAAARFADGTMDPARGALVCVREDHAAGGHEPAHALVRIALDGLRAPDVLVAGRDFVAAPRMSPDGRRLAWLAWDHPNMPWDGTELWLADLDADGRPRDARRVAGGPDVSVVQPEWSPDGVLHFVSDASGWWNLWRLAPDGRPEPLCATDAEFAPPPWILGTVTYGFVGDGRVACAWVRDGRWTLGLLDPSRGGPPEPLPVAVSDVGMVRAGGGRVVARAGGPTTPTSILVHALADGSTATLRRSSTLTLDAGLVSVAEPLTVPGDAGPVHALLYRPRHPDVAGPEGARPPCLVRAHGGPTGAASSAFDPVVQLFTSRGIAVCDVDYGGSTGYGRAYRARLDGQWGVVDVADLVAVARALAARGDVDPARLVARGGSAGGLTVLGALVASDVFAAGSAWYPVADLAALAQETHKFESRYEERLVGPWPARADLYRARSPLHRAGDIRCPVLFLQGLDDRVVPPAQPRAMAEALRARGVPVALVELPGEGHGFRRAESIRRALETELGFLAAVLDLPLADALPRVVPA